MPSRSSWRHCNAWRSSAMSFGRGLSNRRQLFCLFNRFYRRTSKTTSTFYVIVSLWGRIPITGQERGCRHGVLCHDDAIKWKHFPPYWPFVRGIHRWPMNSPHKGQWRGALIFSSLCARINGSENNGDAGDLRRHRTHYDVTAMQKNMVCSITTTMIFKRKTSTQTAT